jgi:hypothetical protein
VLHSIRAFGVAMMIASHGQCRNYGKRICDAFQAEQQSKISVQEPVAHVPHSD